MSLKSIIKGWIGEAQVTIAKKIFLDKEFYTDVNNVTIPSTNGTTQIDPYNRFPLWYFCRRDKEYGRMDIQKQYDIGD
jgi:hypothetical protein